MNYLLLGGTGFLGLNLSKRLASEGHRVKLYSRNSPTSFLNRYPGISHVRGDFFEETSFEELCVGVDIVVHMVTPTDTSNTNIDIESEITGIIGATCRLLDACVKAGVKKVVFISSGGTVYGALSTPPCSESDPTNPISAYGAQKLMIEHLLSLYYSVWGLDFRVIRLSNPYGPLQNPEGSLGAVTKFVHKAIRNEEIAVFGDGTIVRDFVFIDDAIDGLVRVINYDGKYKLFNIGSGKGTSLNELLDAIRGVLSVDLRIRYVACRPSDVSANWLDITRAVEELRYSPTVSLREGIGITANYMRAGESV